MWKASIAHPPAMAAPRAVFPRILDVDAVPGLALDLDAADHEVEFAGGDRDHAVGRVATVRVAAISTSACGNECHCSTATATARRAQLMHRARGRPRAGPRPRRLQREHRAEAARLQRESTAPRRLRAEARLQLDAIPCVEVTRPSTCGTASLLAVHVVFVAIHHRPQRAPFARETAGEHAGLQRCSYGRQSMLAISGANCARSWRCGAAFRHRAG